MALTPIPAIDLKDGRCVRLYQGRFDQVSEYEAAPEELAARYLSLGVDWVHVVDLDGARDGAGGNREVIARMAGLARGRVQVGGGIRGRAEVEAHAGDGRRARRHRQRRRRAARRGAAVVRRLGPERLVLAFDVGSTKQGTPWCKTRGWTEDAGLSLWDAIETYRAAGLRHVLCTDVARDGAMTGPNFELYTECTSAASRLRAAGLRRGPRPGRPRGAARDRGRGRDHRQGLLDGRITDEEIRSFLQNA
jgi:phosphoribosylformimino-5-aminoimidazole carboxamide ribotide isomerase